MVVELWNLVFSSLIHRQRPIWEGWPTKGCLYVAKLRNPCTCTIHIQIFSIAERAKGCMQCRCCSFNHHLSLQSIVISYHICKNYTTIYIIILSEHVYIVYIYIIHIQTPSTKRCGLDSGLGKSWPPKNIHASEVGVCVRFARSVDSKLPTLGLNLHGIGMGCGCPEWTDIKLLLVRFVTS